MAQKATKKTLKTLKTRSEDAVKTWGGKGGGKHHADENDERYNRRDWR